MESDNKKSGNRLDNSRDSCIITECWYNSSATEHTGFLEQAFPICEDWGEAD